MLKYMLWFYILTCVSTQPLILSRDYILGEGQTCEIDGVYKCDSNTNCVQVYINTYECRRPNN
jgi:hypothetical protein